MSDFYALDSNGQAERLKRLALKALDNYELGETDIRLIKHEMNTIFKVTCTHKSGKHGSYVLRIHPSTGLNKSQINSEMIFLKALADDGELVASVPVTAKDGSYVQVISYDDVPNPRCCVLMKWLDGTFLEERLDNGVLENAGEYLARLHRFGRHFDPPEGFVRPTLDFDGLFGESGVFYHRGGDRLFTEEQRETFDQAGMKIKTHLSKLGYGSDQFGLIHGDYYFRNFLVMNGIIGAIDFDICGWGYYLFDLTIPYWPEKQGDITSAYNCFLKGYKRISHLPDALDEYTATFNAIRRLMDAYWIVSRQDHPFLRSLIKHILPGSAQQLKDYLSI